MTLRKIATLLLGAGLTFGILGAGISATFSDQLSATENIQVGTLGCIIDSTTAGTIAAGGHSVTYDVPKIMSSAASSAPFTFTVKATGDIPTKLHLTQTTPAAPFTSLLASAADVTLAPAATHDYAVGLQWPELGPTDMGDTASITYTVACGELPPPTPLIHYTFKSTNADNIAGTAPGHPGAIGPSVAAVDNGPGSITLNFTPGGETGYLHCFEYVTDGNVPQQKLTSNGGVNYNNGTTDGDPIVLDGLFPFKCVGDGQPASASVTLTGISYVQVRMVFGAESDFRFDWTQFDAL